MCILNVIKNNSLTPFSFSFLCLYLTNFSGRFHNVNKSYTKGEHDCEQSHRIMSHRKMQLKQRIEVFINHLEFWITLFSPGCNSTSLDRLIALKRSLAIIWVMWSSYDSKKSICIPNVYATRRRVLVFFRYLVLVEYWCSTGFYDLKRNFVIVLVFTTQKAVLVFYRFFTTRSGVLVFCLTALKRSL